MTPEPLGYLVAERRGGELCLGDEWTTHTTDLGEALATAERWREGGTYDAVVLALVPVDPQTAPAVREIAAGNGAEGFQSPDDAPASDPVPVVFGDRADVALCVRCPKPSTGECCSWHSKPLCHECYRQTHFVEVCVEGCGYCAAEGLPVSLSVPSETAPAAELSAGNGAAPGGYPSPLEASASSPADVGSDEGRADVAPEMWACPREGCGYHVVGIPSRADDVPLSVLIREHFDEHFLDGAYGPLKSAREHERDIVQAQVLDYVAWKLGQNEDPAVSRTLDVAEETVALAKDEASRVTRTEEWCVTFLGTVGRDVWWYAEDEADAELVLDKARLEGGMARGLRLESRRIMSWPDGTVMYGPWLARETSS